MTSSSDLWTVHASRLSDCRTLEQCLTDAGIGFRRQQWSMGQADKRADFHAFQARTGCTHLPVVCNAEGQLIGGLPELETLLAQRERVSAPARILTLAGLLPFLGGAMLLALAPGWPPAHSALISAGLVEAWLLYAALILAFMGGTHWMVQQPWRAQPRAVQQMGPALIVSVVPTLLAVLLLHSGETTAFTALGLALLLLSLLPMDWRHHRQGRISSSYWRLRAFVTLVAAGSLLVGALVLRAAVLIHS